MVHACKMMNDWHVPKDNDCVVPVSQVAYDTFKDDIVGKYEIINNMTAPSDVEGALFLVSATRLSTFEKGQERMIQLAKMLNERKLPFIWIYFADRTLREEVPGMMRMMPTLNISEYIKQANYLVQLSDAEGFCYSIVEALELGTPAIVTDLPVLSEIGAIDGENVHVLPFDMKNIDIDKIYHNRLKGFKYTYDNASRVKQWRKLLGNNTPVGDYNPNEMNRVRIIQKYRDLELNRIIEVGEVLVLRKNRAEQIKGYGVGIIEE